VEHVRRGGFLLALAAALAFGACYDLTVTNPNEPDGARALASPEDAVALVAGSFNVWFSANYSYFGAGAALSNAAFQHTSPWACCGMEEFSRIPRVAFRDESLSASNMTWAWTHAYLALRAVADGLAALEAPGAAGALTPEEMDRVRAFGRFVQGLGHATIAVMYAEGFVVDETVDPAARGQALGYDALMERAMGYLDECAALSEHASWTLPESWMKAALPAPELARVAHSMKARYRAAVARTPAGREAVDWNAVVADVDAGIISDLILDMDEESGWENEALGYGTYAGWSQLGFFVYGMADQSGSYQLWNALPMRDKMPVVNGRPMLIVTPDLRFPRGSTVAEQRLAPGRYFRIQGEGTEYGDTWARPDRGTWRWSWYKHARGEEYWTEPQGSLQPEIRLSEMHLLKAEALYRLGNRSGAAALANESRVEAGLSPTDASGTNTSCVPRLPDGQCGDLLEMLKWEKRMETTFQGPMASLWYFDGRGWGDLWKDSFVQLPMPCDDATILGSPCEPAGGPGGPDAAEPSVYGWNGEG